VAKWPVLFFTFPQIINNGVIMNKSEFVAAFAEKAGLTKVNAEKAVNAFWDTLTEVLEQNDSVTFLGVGTFGVKLRSERTGRNPSTGKEIIIPAAKVIYFKVSTRLKALINRSSSKK